MKRTVMATSLKLVIGVSAVTAVVCAIQGNGVAAVPSGVAAYLAWRLGELAVTAVNLVNQTSVLLRYNATLIAHSTAQAQLIETLVEENRKLTTQGETYGSSQAGAAV